MSQPFVGEIRMFGSNFAPNGWAFCAGQLLPISQNTALFTLIGTTYGGDGETTFALPDLRGRRAIHQGQGNGLQNYVPGEAAGSENVTLTVSQLPQHQHQPQAVSTAGVVNTPTGNSWAQWSNNPYSSAAPTTPMSPAGLGQTGGNQPHSNLPEYLVLNYIISLFGVFPTRN